MAPGIVAFHIADWGAFEGTQTWHHVLAGLAREFLVVYVERPFDRREVAQQLRRGCSRGWGLRRTAPNLYVHTPVPYWPRLHHPPAAAALLRRARCAGLVRSLRHLGVDRVVCYVFHPECVEEAAALPAAVRCFHVYDNYSAFDRARGAWLLAAERELVRRSDLVFASSPLLCQRWLADNPNTHFIPNGVNMELFDDVQGPATEPPALAAIPRPRAAYTGTVNEHLDLALLAHIARRLPQWSLVLMGKVALTSAESTRQFESLCHLPNVFFLGFAPPRQLPAYFDGFDVCLMPYKMDEVMRLSYPLKLNLYLAAGKPVIAAPLPCMAEAEGLIITAGPPEEWVKAVLSSLREERPELARARRAFARRHDWRLQVARISQLIRGQLERSAPSPARRLASSRAAGKPNQ